MLIDWFTVVAQLVNFLILLVALKFLLYDRVVDAMERRQEEIRSRAEEADERAREAEEARERLERERSELGRREEEILDAARERAEERERELLEEARAAVDEQERRWRRSLAREQDDLARDLRRRIASEAVAVARRALRDLADAELEGRVVTAFLERIDGMEDDDRRALEGALGAGEGPIVVRTAFELSDGQRGRLRDALHRLAGSDESEIEWDHDRDLAAGVAIRAGSHTVTWSIDDYLGDLEARFDEMLAREGVGGPDDGGAGPETPADGAPSAGSGQADDSEHAAAGAGS